MISMTLLYYVAAVTVFCMSAFFSFQGQKIQQRFVLV